MKYQVDNAIIMAAGTSSRFAPLSYERPKGLITVKGEVLIERQIRQLREAGIQQIILVVGYKKEEFEYLKDKFNVILVENPWYQTRNNHASIYAVKKYLKNSYICSSDNYFTINPFEKEVDDSYYAMVYSEGETDEWCIHEDADGYIDKVTIGGSHAWYMMGHTFWNEKFSRKFLEILDNEYDLPQTVDSLWEKIYMNHLDELKMVPRHYKTTDIFEFDTLDELRLFDPEYVENTHSVILKDLADKIGCRESEMTHLRAVKKYDNEASGFSFQVKGRNFEYDYQTKEYKEI